MQKILWLRNRFELREEGARKMMKRKKKKRFM